MIFDEMYRIAKDYIIIARDFNEKFANEKELEAYENIYSDVSINDLILNYSFSSIEEKELEKYPNTKFMNCLWILKK